MPGNGEQIHLHLINICGNLAHALGRIGVNADPLYGNTWWGEGEVKMYIDNDEKFPTINGTGTEDYIGTAWGQGQYTNLYQGCTVADNTEKQYAFYRFHIPDIILAIQFHPAGSNSS